MPTKLELERENDLLRAKLEEARALIDDALGYADDDEEDDEEDDD